MIIEKKFRLYLWFCVIKLWWLLLYSICYWWFLLQDFINHSACLGDIWILPLNFGRSVSHFTYWLVYYDFCVRLSHDFVNLMAFCTNEEWDHSFWYKNYNGKDLFFNFFKDLINIMKKAFTTLILFIHFCIKNLNKQMIYLYVTSIQIRNT